MTDECVCVEHIDVYVCTNTCPDITLICGYSHIDRNSGMGRTLRKEFWGPSGKSIVREK